MYVISLSNISTQTNLKQITRVGIKINKFAQYSEGDYIFVDDVMLFVAVHSPNVTTIRSLSMSLYNCLTFFFLEM